MMKRILSFVLASILLFASLSIQIIAKADASSYNSEQSELLHALGVFDNSHLSANSVTRAQFIKYAMKLAGIPLTPYKGVEFKDVPSTHVDYNYIMSAVDFGLISVADNFRPEDTVSPTEAIKIIVHLLGYDFMATAKGGYPSGYLQTAQSIDLSYGISISSQEMTEYDVCALLYNALKVKLPETSYSNNGNDYYIGTSTILNKYRGIIEVSGVIDGVSHYSEYNAQGLGDDNISIGGTIYNTGSLDCDLLYGYDVVAYYDTNKKCLITCTPTDSNKVVSVYAEDIEALNGLTYTYQDSFSKSKTISISPDAAIFFNGRQLASYDKSKMKPESGNLTFVLPNGSGICCALYINSYKTIVVERVFKGEEYIIVDKYDKNNNLVINPDTTELIITGTDGNHIDFSSIAKDDVINYALSDDKKFAELICVSDEILGTYSANGGDYIEIDGLSYRLTPAMKSEVANIVSLGKQAVFRLDIDQRVADIVPAVGEGENIGYLVVGRVYKNGMITQLVARILNLDGKIYNYYFADSFTINGERYKDFETAYDAHKSTDYDSLVCSVVKFAVNDEGKINSLVYPEGENGNGGLYVTGTIEESTGSKLSQWFYNINNTIVASTSTVIFKVPNPLYSVNSVDDDLYSVEKANIFYEDYSTTGYKLEGYTTKENDGMSTYLLAQKIADEQSSEVVPGTNNSCYMVGDIRQVLVEGESREKLNLYGEGSMRVVYSKSENDFSDAGIQNGDIIRVALGEGSVVRGFELIWKYGSDKLSNNSTQIMSSDSKNAQKAIKMAYAYAARGDVLDVVPKGISLESVTTADRTPLYVPQAKIYKYDEKLHTVVELSPSDIKDYRNFGDSRSTLIYHTRYEALLCVFVID